jgi:hypothetical protein
MRVQHCKESPQNASKHLIEGARLPRYIVSDADSECYIAGVAYFKVEGEEAKYSWAITPLTSQVPPRKEFPWKLQVQ